MRCFDVIKLNILECILSLTNVLSLTLLQVSCGSSKCNILTLNILYVQDLPRLSLFESFTSFNIMDFMVC